MPNAPAPITKIMNAIVTLIAPTGLVLHTNRTDYEPLDESERPGIIGRVPHIEFSPSEFQSQELNLATFHFDFQSSSTAGETIDQINQNNIATFMKTVAADRMLGGRLQSFEFTAVSGSEADGADVGTAILEAAIMFFTMRDDPFVIVGQAGTYF